METTYRNIPVDFDGAAVDLSSSTGPGFIRSHDGTLRRINVLSAGDECLVEFSDGSRQKLPGTELFLDLETFCGFDLSLVLIEQVMSTTEGALGRRLHDDELEKLAELLGRFTDAVTSRG